MNEESERRREGRKEEGSKKRRGQAVPTDDCARPAMERLPHLHVETTPTQGVRLVQESKRNWPLFHGRASGGEEGKKNRTRTEPYDLCWSRPRR